MSDKSIFNQRILVIAAHPDDEVLGCGGVILKHSHKGDQVTVVIACEGESLRYGDKGVGQKEDSKAAAMCLGYQDLRWLDFPDQRLDQYTLTDIISPIEKIVQEIQPHIVYCQYGGDINRDHSLLFKAALVATRPTNTFIESVLAFYTSSSTEWAYPRSFIPDTWINISKYLTQKLRAMECYKSEIHPYPHPRSLQALECLAHSWGTQCCLDAAEVFMTIRKVCRYD